MDSDFDSVYAVYQARAEKTLRGIMDQRREEPTRLHDAMAYSLFAGGKRFRPVLMLAAHGMGIVQDDRIDAFAAAVEMIHTYSLIHDDLPAMDDDDLRRGKPTCHTVYGEAMGILAGDGLLNLAFEVMADAVGENPEPRSAAAMAAVARAAGAHGMVGGQVADMQGLALLSDGDLLWFVHRRKTGALIRASLEAGFVLGGAGESELGAIRGYGDALGMVFQIKDDLLDAESTAEALGKPIGSDEKNGKKTFVTVYGAERAREMLSEWLHRAEESLTCFGEQGIFLRDMVRFAESRSR